MTSAVDVNSAFWRGRRVLVTGHTGFKGGWLCLWLARAGAEVVGYSDGVPTEPSLYESARIGETLTSVTGDIRDRQLLMRVVDESRAEVVFHLAAQSLVRRSFAEPALTYETNVLGTANVLEAVGAVGSVRAALIVTTDKVYEPKPERRYREDDPLGGSDPYSTSKVAAELVTAAYRASVFPEDGPPRIATARAGNVIGGGDWAPDRLVPDVIRALLSEQSLSLRYPQAIRPWQHVLDPITGYLSLAERLLTDRSVARAWNFGPDPSEEASAESMAQWVARHWGADLRIVAPETPQPPEALSLRLDSTRAREELAWRPRLALDEAIATTVTWYRAYARGEDMQSVTLAQIEAFTGTSAVLGAAP